MTRPFTVSHLNTLLNSSSGPFDGNPDIGSEITDRAGVVIANVNKTRCTYETHALLVSGHDLAGQLRDALLLGQQRTASVNSDALTLLRELSEIRQLEPGSAEAQHRNRVAWMAVDHVLNPGGQA